MYNPYDPTEKGADYYHDPIPSPPPPPDWNPKRNRRPWFVFVLIAIIVAATGFVATMSTSYWIHHQESPIATPQPVMSPHYTVEDITSDMKKDGCPCGYSVYCPDGGQGPVTCTSTDKLIYGSSISDVLGTDYMVNVQAQDSAMWNDPPSDGQAFSAGLWVYVSKGDAQSALLELNTDIARPDAIFPPSVYFHGRCLLLVANADTQAWTGYQKSLSKYCV